MLFSEEDAPHLKKWIVKRLENTYVADPKAMHVIEAYHSFTVQTQMQMYLQTMFLRYFDTMATRIQFVVYVKQKYQIS